ncbi:MAG: putative oxidoreductase [Alphaproteobacteria bacterium]|nr:putative oxidoreductase [Alphaproteobacteria bacterium]
MNTAELETIWAPRVLSILRIVAGLLLWQHGLQKLVGFLNPGAPMPAMGTLIWFAGVIETTLPPFLILGLFTRPVAFILSGHLAFVYWIGHAPKSFYPFVNGGSIAVLYCFVFFYLAFAGGGAWSLDNVLRRKRVMA